MWAETHSTTNPSNHIPSDQIIHDSRFYNKQLVCYLGQYYYMMKKNDTNKQGCKTFYPEQVIKCQDIIIQHCQGGTTAKQHAIQF